MRQWGAWQPHRRLEGDSGARQSVDWPSSMKYSNVSERVPLPEAYHAADSTVLPSIFTSCAFRKKRGVASASLKTSTGMVNTSWNTTTSPRPYAPLTGAACRSGGGLIVMCWIRGVVVSTFTATTHSSSPPVFISVSPLALDSFNHAPVPVPECVGWSGGAD